MEQEAARWADEPADQLEQRRLTAAGGANQRDEFVLPDRKIDLRERGDRPPFEVYVFSEPSTWILFISHNVAREGSAPPARTDRNGCAPTFGNPIVENVPPQSRKPVVLKF
jgi:hypothetical protein